MAVTTKDLARICGVSRATVNRALHNLAGINDETKKRILATAEELGYQPNLIARTMVRGKSMTIGVIVVDLRNQYFAEMLNAMEKKAKEYGYILNITLHEQDKQTELKLIQTLVGHRVDGIVISAISPVKEFQQYLEKLGVPIVLIGCRATENIASVGIDEYQATKDAVDYIVGKGYKKAVFVVPPLDSNYNMYIEGHEHRAQGFEDGAKVNGIEYEVIKSIQYCSKSVELINKSEQKTAFLCSGAKFAGDLIFYCNKHGLQAGKDYGVMSFDKIDFFEHMEPQMTIVDNHIADTGQKAIELLMGMVEKGERGESVTILHNIIPGMTL